MTKRFEVTKPSQVTKRRCAMGTPKGKPKGRAASTAAVAIDGADSKGTRRTTRLVDKVRRAALAIFDVERGGRRRRG